MPPATNTQELDAHHLYVPNEDSRAWGSRHATTSVEGEEINEKHGVVFSIDSLWIHQNIQNTSYIFIHHFYTILEEIVVEVETRID